MLELRIEFDSGPLAGKLHDKKQLRIER